MSHDELEQLRRENPVPDPMPALPIAPILARLDEQRTPLGRPRRPRRWDRALPLALSGLVVLVVAGAALTLGGHSHSDGSAASRSRPAKPGHRRSPTAPRRTPAPHVNPAQVARDNAHDSPTKLFTVPYLNGTAGATGPGTTVAETVIPATVRELGTFSLAGVGRVQYWTAETRQHGVCGGLRLPGGVWAELQKNAGTGSMPGCSPTRAQVGHGALIIDGFDYITSGVFGRQGQRWVLAYGAVSIPDAVTRVRDTHSGIEAAIVRDNHFVVALHPVGNDWGDYVRLEAYNASGQRVALQGRPLAGTPTTQCVGRYDVRRVRIPHTHRYTVLYNCRGYKRGVAK